MRLFRFVFGSWSKLARASRLMRDERVPLGLKLAALALALLILSPLNILGDIPLLGVADDAVMLGGLAALFVRLAESALQRNVTAAPGGAALMPRT